MTRVGRNLKTLHRIVTMLMATVLALSFGCGEEKKKPKAVVVAPPKVVKSETPPPSERPGQAADFKPKSKTSAVPRDVPEERRTLAGLAEQGQRAIAFNDNDVVKPRMDETRAGTLGIRKIVGKHLILFTDLPADREVDELAAMFDLAVPQWCEYFAIPAARVEKWQLYGYLMKEKEKFVTAGALGGNLPDFPHGFQQGREMWWYEQPTPYYRRHLMLHEGTHGLMAHFLGNYGPPWYAEGMAELLATHKWEDGKLELRHVPRDRNETPGWGRIKIVRDGLAAKKAKRLDEVMQYGPHDHYQVEPYGWCWAAAYFLDNHSRSQKLFRELKKEVSDFSIEFSLSFQKRLGDDWRILAEDWQLFVTQLDYGMDVTRMEVLRGPVVTVPAEGGTVKIAADRGYQTSGWRIEEGRKYQIIAKGRYQVGTQPKPWWCEPGGITFHYYQGMPLGMLVGAICADDQPLQGLTPLAVPDPIGLGREFTAERSGTLYLRVNEFCGQLADNSGTVDVRIVPK